MKASDTPFSFPILGFFPGPMGYDPRPDVYGFPDLHHLTSINGWMLKNSKLIGTELVDSNGRRWRVRSVRKTGLAQSPLRWLIVFVSGPPQLRIDYELEELEPTPWAEVRERVAEVYEAGVEVPYTQGDRDDLARGLSRTRAAANIAEVIEILGLEYVL